MGNKILLIFGFLLCAAPVFAQTASDWHMAGANPQRTSWVTEEVRGNLGVEWYQAIEPYIPYKIQPVFYNGVAYVSTSKGLYAFDLNSTVGAGGTRVKWVYPTELPLGHSPTITTVNGKVVAYVGGFDRNIHAIDVSTGQALTGYTPFEADAGFETNPLVINDSFTNNTAYIIAGNRDGKLYALHAATGVKIWQFQTNGPILYSAAYKSGVIYFASNDLYAYAINISNGTQIWKSQKFQYSAGFFSYWPMVYTEKNTGKIYVSFTGATNYRNGDEAKPLNQLDMEYFVPGCMGLSGPGCPSQLWNTSTATNDPYFTNGTKLDDVNGNATVPGITTYFETYPHRRYVFILDAATGNEYSFDSNGNGKSEYAPFVWSGGTTYAGSKYPGLVNGVDGIYYQTTMIQGSGWISRSDPVGWKFGSHTISEVSGGSHAIDEPLAYSSGGKVMYWALCCDREAGAFDVTLPLTTSERSWNYWGYSLNSLAPDYRTMYNDGDNPVYNNDDGWQLYAGKNKSKNGVYGKHTIAQSPPIPYGGKVYTLKGNALIALKASAPSPVKLSLAPVTTVQKSPGTPVSTTLKSRLETEIQKIVNTGPLRPGYFPSSLLGHFSGNYSDWHTIGDLLDYFSNPADTVYTLLLAYPHVSSTTQTQIKTYVQNYYGPGKTYDITQIQHVGWSTGAAREASTIPPDRMEFRVGNPSSWKPCCANGYWEFPPFNFYAAWKYAQIIGNNDPAFAKNIFNSMSGKIEAPTNDTFLIQKPYFLNSYAAGYYGYLQLKQLAGLGSDTTVQGYYNHVMNLRLNNFSKDTPYWPASTWCGTTNNCGPYWSALSISANFIWLTPEIAAQMKQIQSAVQTAIGEYVYVAPYWFVNKFDATPGEGTFQPLYDSPALFQAKAWILGQSYEELTKYLDVPAFEKGDLFYIQNLVVALQAGGTSPPTPTAPAGKAGDANGDGFVNYQDFLIWKTNYGKNLSGSSSADFDGNNTVNGQDYIIWLFNFGI